MEDLDDDGLWDEPSWMDLKKKIWKFLANQLDGEGHESCGNLPRPRLGLPPPLKGSVRQKLESEYFRGAGSTAASRIFFSSE